VAQMPMVCRQDVRDWVRRHLAAQLGISADDLVLSKSVYEYGLDSVDAVLLAGELEEAFAIQIDPAAFLQHPTLEAMIVSLDLTPSAGA
jgi:acyl carrier protein